MAAQLVQQQTLLLIYVCMYTHSAAHFIVVIVVGVGVERSCYSFQ